MKSIEKMLKIAIPKGRIHEKVLRLLDNAGIKIKADGRSYKPYCSDPEIEIKVLRARNIPKLVEIGSQDIGFTGFDFVKEQQADIVELLDLGYDTVNVVAAIPSEYTVEELKKRKITVASEYENLTKEFLRKENYNATFVRTYGATEVFPPDDADMIIDNSSTGKTLSDNGLKIIERLLQSSTRCIANKNSLSDSWKKKKIDDLLMLFRSVLAAEERVFIEMNVNKEDLDRIIPELPCMKMPTISKLYGDQGYAVKIGVLKNDVNSLLPKLKSLGATDILVFKLEKAVLWNIIIEI